MNCVYKCGAELMKQTLMKILKFPGLHKNHEDEEIAEKSVLKDVVKKCDIKTMKTTYKQVFEKFSNLPAPSLSSVKMAFIAQGRRSYPLCQKPLGTSNPSTVGPHK